MIKISAMEDHLLKNGIEVVAQKDFIGAINKINNVLSEIFNQKDLAIEYAIVRFEFFVEVGRFFVVEFLFDSLGGIKKIYSKFLTMFKESSDIFCTIFIPSEDFYESFNSSPDSYFYTVDEIENILKRHGLRINVSLLGVEFTIPFDAEVKEYLI
jgi:hypothetical protein